jgi:hypothetical protein
MKDEGPGFALGPPGAEDSHAKDAKGGMLPAGRGQRRPRRARSPESLTWGGG